MEPYFSPEPGALRQLSSLWETGHVLRGEEPVSSCCRTICPPVTSPSTSPSKLAHTPHTPFYPHPRPAAVPVPPTLCKHSPIADSSCAGEHNAWGCGGGGCSSAGLTPHLTPARPLACAPFLPVAFVRQAAPSVSPLPTRTARRQRTRPAAGASSGQPGQLHSNWG